MHSQMKTCRVCGKKYEACHSARTGATVFNWKEVACSPECGKKYLDMVMAKRGAVAEVVEEKPVEPVEVFEEPIVEEVEEEAVEEIIEEETIDEFEDEDEEELEDEFDIDKF